MSISAVLNELFQDIQQQDMLREVERVRTDPTAHKLTRIMQEGNLSYRYYYPISTKGRTTYYCHTTSRNVAGYFLTFREVHTGSTVKRDMWVASKRKQIVIAKAFARMKAHKARLV